MRCLPDITPTQQAAVGSVIILIVGTLFGARVTNGSPASSENLSVVESKEITEVISKEHLRVGADSSYSDDATQTLRRTELIRR